jgi:hypothetical protein
MACLAAASRRTATIDALMGWPLRVTQGRGLFADAWRYEQTSPSLMRNTWRLPRTLAPTSLSDDGRLANGPGLPVRVLHLPG